MATVHIGLGEPVDQAGLAKSRMAGWVLLAWMAQRRPAASSVSASQNARSTRSGVPAEGIESGFVPSGGSGGLAGEADVWHETDAITSPHAIHIPTIDLSRARIGRMSILVSNHRSPAWQAAPRVHDTCTELCPGCPQSGER